MSKMTFAERVFGCRHIWKVTETKEIYGLSKNGKRTKLPILVGTKKECTRCIKTNKNINLEGKWFFK